MKKNSFSAAIAVAAATLIGVTACSSASVGSSAGPSNGDKAALTTNGDKAALTIGVFNGWPEGEAASYLWKSILEKKGYVAHAQDGRAYVYTPVVERSDATRSEVRHLVQRLFRDSHELLVLNILEDSDLTADELQHLKQYLKDRE